MNQHIKKDNDGWKRVLHEIVFDKAAWMLAALCLLGWSYWKQSQYTVSPQRFEFSFLQMASDSKIDSSIQTELISLLHRTKADRVYIMQFHNGGELAGGNPFQKMSCSHEEVSLGTSRELSNLQDIPLSAIPECINELITKDTAFLMRVEEVKCGVEKSMLIRRGARIAAYARINVGGKLIGYLAINYVRSTYLNDPSDTKQIEKVLAEMNLTEGFLELELEKK